MTSMKEFMAGSLILMLLALLTILPVNLREMHAKKTLSRRAHGIICAAVAGMGCLVRLVWLGTLPAGISAEEALVGVQAKALWQTGGFLFEGKLTTQLAQWSGESTGPLLAVLTAPFVGVFGMHAWTVRLPLALLSCGAMAAAYGVGRQLGGKRAARWCLTIYALCPYFVLAARMTCGANAAVCLLPMAVYAALRGMDKPGWLYIGAALIGLMAYAQDMYFYISPLAVSIVCITAASYGMRKRHALAAWMLGMAVCLPATLTLWVNRTGREGFDLLNMIRIPALESFDRMQTVRDILIPGYEAYMVAQKVCAVVAGAVFQVLSHLNISNDMFAPEGLQALYMISIPLILLGGFSLFHDAVQGRCSARWEAFGRTMVLLLAAATLACLIMYGSIGVLNTTTGNTSVFDYSAFFLFDVLLMAAGLCRMERRSSMGISVLSALMLVSFAMLCTHLFGAGYRNGANTYFTGFGELAVRAEELREGTDTKVSVTNGVYPHIQPDSAAEIMYLYAVDADMEHVLEYREHVEVIYAPGMEPDPDRIYLVRPNEIGEWDLEPFHYEELDEYVLLIPKTYARPENDL